jgi:hypothetical protein
MCNVMASLAEAKIGALYTNVRKGEELRLMLEEIGHVQPPTPIMMDNSAACRIINKTGKQHRTRTIGMRFYWICNRVAQNHFIVSWAPGKNNLEDYHTKHHPDVHHQCVRSTYCFVENL